MPKYPPHTTPKLTGIHHKVYCDNFWRTKDEERTVPVRFIGPVYNPIVKKIIPSKSQGRVTWFDPERAEKDISQVDKISQAKYELASVRCRKLQKEGY